MLRLTTALLVCLFSSIACAQTNSLKEAITSIIKNKQANVGVAIIYNQTDTLTVNNDDEYPTMSVYKFHQSLAVLDYLDTHSISLDSKIFLKKEDLRENAYSPLRDLYPDGNMEMPIRDLIKYAVSKSDNNASNILFDYLLGTKATDLYLRSLGYTFFLISATEREMDLQFENQYLNWTTPLEAVKLMDQLLYTNILSGEYKNFLIQALVDTETGANKLKGLLPKNVVVGHKTGNSSRNTEGVKVADNDLGFVYLPSEKSYSIGVFVKDSKETDEVNASMIAQINKAVYDFYLHKN